MIKIILSALNEAQNLKILIPNLAQEISKIKREYEIIICLDGSTDDSAQIILAQQKYYPIRILDFVNKEGLGNAYKKLLLDLIENSDAKDIAISMDADNTHSPLQIAKAIDNFEKNNLDLLILSRFCKTSKSKGFPIFRQFISKIVSILLQFCFGAKKISGQKVKDYSSGYRIYKVEKLQELHQKYGKNLILEQNFVYTCEILQKFAKNNARIDEIALFYDYSRKIGASKLKFWQNFYQLCHLIAHKGNV